jgi:hydrogenase nickel incorporation protein HypA/HybF
MHEFSICQQIIKLVKNELSDDVRVKNINLSIGQLTALDTESLIFWFPIAAQNSQMANASINIKVIDAKAECKICSASFVLEHRLFACPYCQAYDYQLLSGEELTINNVELE